MQKSATTPFFSLGRRTGSPFVAGDAEIVPHSLVLVVHWRWFGYVWNWPLGVTILRNGKTDYHRVVDVTRLALWALGIVAFLALGLSSSRRSSHTKDEVHA